MSVINEWVTSNRYSQDGNMSRHVICASGLRMSVQASSDHYCRPRVDNAESYTHFEIGFPSNVVPQILEYAEDADSPTGTVYCYVPAEVIDAVIAENGGIDGVPARAE